MFAKNPLPLNLSRLALPATCILILLLETGIDIFVLPFVIEEELLLAVPLNVNVPPCGFVNTNAVAVVDIDALPNSIVFPARYKSLNLLELLPKSYVIFAVGIIFPVIYNSGTLTILFALSKVKFALPAKLPLLLYCISVVLPPTLAEPPVTLAHVKLPVPSVCKYWLALPPVILTLLTLPKLKLPLLNVTLGMPAKEPELLYCNSVVLPPGVPLPPPPPFPLPLKSINIPSTSNSPFIVIGSKKNP